MSLYEPQHRQLQDQFDARALADRLEQVIVREEITASDQAFIEAREFFFLSTVMASGEPTVSFKGGLKGFVKVLDNKTIAFPSYNGNGMFFSTGNLLHNPPVGLLFIDFERPNRIRFHGTATITPDDALLAEYPEAELIIRVRLTRLWPNCPRYIPDMQKVADSKNIPRAGEQTPLADWKRIAGFHDALPEADKQRVNQEGGPLTPEAFAALMASRKGDK